MLSVTPPSSDTSDTESAPVRRGRGRARSGAFHTGDPILADLDAVLGTSPDDDAAPVASGPPSVASAGAGSGSGSGAGSFGSVGSLASAGSSGSGSGGSVGSGSGSDSGGEDDGGMDDGRLPRKKPGKKVGTVSRKTAEILTTLEPHPPGSSYPPHPHADLLAEEVKDAGDDAEASGPAGGASAAASASVPIREVIRRPRRKDPQEYDVCIKLLLLGDAGVGKTSLMTRYAEQQFSTSLLSTAGVDYKTKFLKVCGKTVKCQIWDTAGQQRFHVITQTYYGGAHGIILVYDVSDPTEESFNNVSYWMENIRTHASPTTQKILLGNKIDVPGRKVSTAKGKAMADQFDLQFLETSAKEGTNVSRAFHTIAKEIIQRQRVGPPTPPVPAQSKPSSKKRDRCTVM